MLLDKLLKKLDEKKGRIIEIRRYLHEQVKAAAKQFSAVQV